ncbi:MAG: xanthine dehydrogenase family protein molybdopterin-binding subunit [Dehalococcoidia bacterium]|nr:xanthine dehydrogenase family protein molybdopterin-binding subunit [Dehalococcoidia bacterium]
MIEELPGVKEKAEAQESTRGATPDGPKGKWKVIGTRPIRHDGADKVTGRAKYGIDFLAADLLHGKILRSPHAHARIKRIDVSRALAYPGVKAVLTANDFPPLPANLEDAPAVDMRYLPRTVMAKDKVLFKGHPVAAVAAINTHVAEEALALIDVEYEVLPAVLDGVESMKEGAPLLHAGMTTKVMGTDTGRISNVANHHQLSLGDVAKGFREADVIVEREFRTASVHQGYIEPQNATALWNKDGKITIWTSNQGPLVVRKATAQLVGVPYSHIRVIPLEIGGGFGGKITPYLDPIAALLSRKTARPVKIVMTRQEVFEASGPTAGSYIRVKVGATKDGRITAAQAYLVYEAGAFPGSPVGGPLRCMFTPYRIPNVEMDGFDVVVNRTKTTAYRAPGVTNAAFASETVIDEICEKIGMDPLEFRLKNAVVEGDRRPDGTRFAEIGCVEVFQAAKDSPHWNAPLKGKHRGRGMAAGFWGNGGLFSSCTLGVNSDGTVSVVTGSVDIGGSRVAMAMHAAEVLGLRAEDIIPSVGDTDSVGETSVTGGSRTTFATGMAVYEAAQAIKRQMIERAAKLWETTPEDVDLVNGVFVRKSHTDRRMTFKELSGHILETGGPVVASASANPKAGGPTFVLHIADVEVDEETGKVDVLRYTAVQDVGQAIHPSYVEGQMQGGAAQGIGWALSEEYVYNSQGAMVNSSFLDYRMPTALDLPMIDTIVVQVPNPGSPVGTRGVAEGPVIPAPAAIANAIHQAIGVRMNVLPMSPTHVLEALWAKEKAKKR